MLFAFAAFGQVSSSFSSGPNGVYSGSATFQPPMYMGPALTGAPYSGEQMFERVQTLLDGTHITQKNSGDKTWRDSQGRTRTERALGGPNMKNAPTMIQISDPVAGYQYTLDTDNRVAHRMALPAGPPGLRQSGNGNQTANRVVLVPGGGGGGGVGGGAANAIVVGVLGGTAGPPAGAIRPNAAQASDTPRPQTSTQQLGTKLIDGVLVEGRQQTTVYPIGFQGNDGPITVVSEHWYSPDLRLTVLSTTNDPRSGVSTTKIANLSRSEPDPSLFMVPAGYSIVDETGAFTIQYGAK
ncbi:MAG TPA: hypothetical protein VLY04_16410 [Bryobacteraceae bacterium]|nr:hypothetical protein [Bryobacteraceae bacterium]